jgi:hypothetical protein
MKLQQGDVILNKIEITEKELENGKMLNHLTLAEGESTGHHHSIISGVAQLIILNNKTILNVLSDYAKLEHQEHKSFEVPKGKWEVKIVREYDPFEEEIRQVKD